MQIALPLAGTGVRGIRLRKEVAEGKIRSISMNDQSDEAVRVIRKNLKLNRLSTSEIKVSQADASLFLLSSKGFDYIDIDPFGSPGPFLDAAMKRLSRRSILAVTATDTSALAGTCPNAGMRKYWARPMRNELMHEIGLRILIRKCQLIASQYERGLFPVFSYSKDHYLRVFFRCEKGKSKSDSAIKNHGLVLYCQKCGMRKTVIDMWSTGCGCGAQFDFAGPMYLGPLWDPALVRRMVNINKAADAGKLLDLIKSEMDVGSALFYDIHELCKKHKVRDIPRTEAVLRSIRALKYKAAVTHFSPLGIRSNIGFDEMVQIIKECGKKKKKRLKKD